MAAPSFVLDVDWETDIPVGPKQAFHTGCVIRQCLYIHGGISDQRNKHPSSKLYRIDLNQRIWGEVLSPGSPVLSHHESVALDDRYMLLIGGWNGKSRSGKLHIFDTETNSWQVPNQTGFPTDAGLSSHTATRLANGDILILGRDGSLRTQRRHGDAYVLKGTVEKGFTFNEFCRSIISRSGHTTNIVGSTMYVIGGRSDKLLEYHYQGGFLNGSNCQLASLEKLYSKIKTLPPMSKIPCGRKHHISISGPDCILLHGGETFDGRSREPVGEMFFVTLKPAPKFVRLSDSRIKRAGHICFTDGEDVFIHGGLTGKYSLENICGDTQRLKIPESVLTEIK